MRRVIVPALLAVAMVASTSSNASAFGLFDKFCKSGCDTGCAVEPACGCEAPAPCGCAIEPACGCEVAAPCGCAAEPMCGCEVVDPCGCDSGCKTGGGLLAKLFGKKRSACDTGCCEVVEPSCGFEVPAPCGCAVEPACGCEVAMPVCDSGCCGAKPKPFGLLRKLFSCKKSGCDDGCAIEPACGCEVIEPACGCEVAAPCGCQ